MRKYEFQASTYALHEVSFLMICLGKHKNQGPWKDALTAQIAEIMLKEVFERISIKGIQLEVTDRFKTRLIDEGYNPTYGARPLRRAVMRLLEDSLAEEVLSEKIKAGDTAVVDVGEDNKVKVLLGEKFEVLQES